MITPTDKRKGKEYLEQLDLPAVSAAIRDTPTNIAVFDFDALGEMVVAAAERWLARDVEEYFITGVETYFQDKDLNTHGIVDLTLVRKSDDKVRICDWKTTKNANFDLTWVNRYRDSMQWKQYMVSWVADEFEYRGVNREASTKVLEIDDIPTNLIDIVYSHYSGIATQQNALAPLDVYPRHMPEACFKFGRMCEYIGDCRNHTMPRFLTAPQTMSYSRTEQFQRCPEQYRRDRGEKLIEIEPNYDAEIGNCFHRGIAEVYRQSAKLFQGRDLPIVTKENYNKEETK